METVLLNDQLSVSIPDGFHVMSREEISQLNFSGEAPQWCIRDEERHVIFTIAWKKTNALFSMVLSEKDVAKSMEKSLRGSMQSVNYQLEEFVSSSLDGKSAEGFTYDYVVDDVGMHGIIYSVKQKKCFYYIYGYIRQQLRKEGEEAVEQILNSISWK